MEIKKKPRIQFLGMGRKNRIKMFRDKKKKTRPRLRLKALRSFSAQL
jgi:hypothetical protein